MNINRHNYEEFFLLYVDDELETAQRVMVEKFVQENTDLAGELEMLKQVMLPKEPVSFTGKELLYKKETGISLSNYQEYFLLFVDNELSQNQKDEVEKFVLQHPELQNEFTVLQQTKLEPEHIPFINKAALYRKTEPRKIIPIGWMKLGIAAAVLGLIVTLWVFKQDNSQPAVAVTEQKPIIIQEKIQPTTPALEEKNIASSNNRKDAISKITGSSSVNNKPGKTETIVQNKKNNKKKINQISDHSIPAPKEGFLPDNSPAMAVDKKEEQKNIELLPKPSNQSNIKVAAKEVHETKLNNTFVNRENMDHEPALAINTLYKEIEAEEDDKVIYIGGSQINKNKLKGLFKKAAGFLDKKISRNLNEKLLQ